MVFEEKAEADASLFLTKLGVGEFEEIEMVVAVAVFGGDHRVGFRIEHVEENFEFACHGHPQEEEARRFALPEIGCQEIFISSIFS